MPALYPSGDDYQAEKWFFSLFGFESWFGHNTFDSAECESHSSYLKSIKFLNFRTVIFIYMQSLTDLISQNDYSARDSSTIIENSQQISFKNHLFKSELLNALWQVGNLNKVYLIVIYTFFKSLEYAFSVNMVSYFDLAKCRHGSLWTNSLHAKYCVLKKNYNYCSY